MAETKQKRKDLSLQEKRKILECYDKLPKMSQRSAAVHLKLSQPLLCKILKNRAKIEISSFANQNLNRKRRRYGKDRQVESALKIWYGNVREKNALINGPIMRQKAEQLAKIMGKEDFIATGGWFNRWKKRENIMYKNLRSKDTNSELLPANEWIRTQWTKIIGEYSPQDIYNADETSLYFRAMPDRLRLFKSETVKECKLSDDRVTVLCCVSMTGEKRDLLVIGTSKNPRCFNGVKCLPVDYFSSANACMTNIIFNNWLLKWDLELKRKIVLLVDNCSAHIYNVSLANIKMIVLPSNITSLFQSSDRGITRTMKAYYRAQIIVELNGMPDRSEAAAAARKVSLLDVLHLLAMAWRRVGGRAVESCFPKFGFSKFTSETIASKDSNVVAEIWEKIPGDMSKDEFESWVDIDGKIEAVTSPIAETEMCQDVAGDDIKFCERPESDPLAEDDVPEAPPTNDQMQKALQTLRRGVQYRAVTFEKHYEYESYIQELINANIC